MRHRRQLAAAGEARRIQNSQLKQQLGIACIGLLPARRPRPHPGGIGHLQAMAARAQQLVEPAGPVSVFNHAICWKLG